MHHEIEMKQIPMAKNSSFSLISTNKIIQMNDVWTSYDSKNFALSGVNLSRWSHLCE